MNAPKGIDRYQDKLFAADLKELVIIDLKNRTTLKKIHVPEAGMLNDVAAASDGSIFVSDSKAGSIYKFSTDSYIEVIGNLSNPNGLLVHGNTLYYVDNGSLYSCDLDGQRIQLLAKGMLGSTDGIQMTKEGDFIISCSIGTIYFVGKNGHVELLHDSRNEKKNTADIAYDMDEQILYIPTFFKKSIEAYRLAI